MDWFYHIIAFLALLTVTRVLAAVEEIVMAALKSGARWLDKTNRPSYVQFEREIER